MNAEANLHHPPPTPSPLSAANEDSVKSLLTTYRIARPPGLVVALDDSADSIIESPSFRSLRFPVVLKALGSDLHHKTERGGIRLGIGDGGELAEAVIEFRERFPGGDLLIEEHIPHSLEFILGVRLDDVYGHMIMFGSGGILTEVYHDVVYRRLPLTRAEARDMIDATKIGIVFHGFRGMEIPMEPVIDAILGIGRMIEHHASVITELEINPLIIVDSLPMALDAKLVTHDHL